MAGILPHPRSAADWARVLNPDSAVTGSGSTLPLSAYPVCPRTRVEPRPQGRKTGGPMGQVRGDTARALLRRIAVEQAECGYRRWRRRVVRDGRARLVRLARPGGREPRPPPTPSTGSDRSPRAWSPPWSCGCATRAASTCSTRSAKHLPGHPGRRGDHRPAAVAHRRADAPSRPARGGSARPGMPAEDLLGPLGPETARHRPGRRYHYSNLGFALLGELVARLRGTCPGRRPYSRRSCGRSAWPTPRPRPRAPHATGYAVHPWADVLLPEPEHDAVAMAPAGQLWSTPADLARWAAFVAGDTGGVLRPATLAEMREPADRRRRRRLDRRVRPGPAAHPARRPPPGRAHRLHAGLPGHRVGRPRRRGRACCSWPTPPPG